MQQTTELIIAKYNELLDPIFALGGSAWTIPVDWTIQPGPTFGITHTPGVSSSVTQDILREGVFYKVTWKVSGMSAGQVRVLCGNGSAGPYESVDGTYVVTLQALPGTPTLFYIDCTVPFDGTVAILSLVEAPGQWNLDLLANADYPMTFQIADIRDPSKKNTTYSKTLNLPGSKVNDAAFQSSFEISQDCLFNPNKKVRAVVLQDGLEVFNGVLQLKAVNRQLNGFGNYDAVSYDVVLLGNLADIFYQLGDTLVENLDMSEYDHVYNMPNQISSWGVSHPQSATPGIFEDGTLTTNWLDGPQLAFTSCYVSASPSGPRPAFTTTMPHGFAANQQIAISYGVGGSVGLYVGDHKVWEVIDANNFSIWFPWDTSEPAPASGFVWAHKPYGVGYVYPMIEDAITADATTGYSETYVIDNNFQVNGIGTNNWTVGDLRPAIYLKTILDAIFKSVGYTYQSSFLADGKSNDDTAWLATSTSLARSDMFRRLVVPASTKDFGPRQDTLNQRNVIVGLAVDTALSGAPALNYNTQAEMWLSGASAGNQPIDFTIYNRTLPINDNSTTDGFYDPGFNFDTVTHVLTCAVTGHYDSSLNMSAWNYVIPPEDFYLWESTGEFSNLYLTLWNLTTDEQVPNTSTQQYGLPATGIEPISIDINWTNVWMNAGNQYCVRYSWKCPNLFGDTVPHTVHPHVKLVAGAGTTWTVTCHPTYAEGDLISVSDVLPRQVLCRDFITSVSKMFNLYIDVDKDNPTNLLIEPRNDFYAAGTTVDWTDKLDLSKPLQLQPMAELNARYYNYRFSSESDCYNTAYLAKFPTPQLDQSGNTQQPLGYGDRSVIVDNDFIKANNDTTVLFGATLLDESPAGSGRVISQSFSGTVVPPSMSTTDTKPKMLYFSRQGNSSQNRWNYVTYTAQSVTSMTITGSGTITFTVNAGLQWLAGDLVAVYYSPSIYMIGIANSYNSTTGVINVTFTQSSGSGTFSTWNVMDISRPVTWDYHPQWIYPYAGHLDKTQEPQYDFNWGLPSGFISLSGANYLPTSWTDQNLFNVYYSDMMAEITGKDSKFVTAWFWLHPSDIYALDFRNVFRVDGHILRLNRIINYSLLASVPTQVEFVKAEIINRYRPAFGSPWTLIQGGITSVNADFQGGIGAGIQIIGVGNVVGLGSSSIAITGNSNVVGANSSKISILASSNISVDGGLTNVVVINSNNHRITESNQTWINDNHINTNWQSYTSTANRVDAGQDNILFPFNYVSQINQISAGLNDILDAGSSSFVTQISAGQDDILDGE